ncbi:MAG TPA: phospholipase D-like domain-containing protein [Thermodesulfovibrionales bacterium]|nr:phospholipase D-like domain-containing protein [Thermodesulfovibrionales bacterium]
MTFQRETIEKIYGGSFVDDNAVRILYKGKESFDAIFRGIEHARHVVCLHFYIFRNDETGRELAGILRKKAEEGVRIYVLYDHFGSFGTPKAFWNELRDAGIRIRASRPFRWSSPFHYAHRDHRKLVIIDGIRAFTGGLNIANEYRGFHLRMRHTAWRDTGIFVEGPVARELFLRFVKTWQTWRGEPIDVLEIPGSSAVHDRARGLPVITIFASSSKGRRKMRKLLYYSINHARRSVLLTTAYFTPSRRMLDSLEEAVKRGVEVKLLLPGKSDVPAAYHTGRAFFTRLLKAGVRIFTYQGEVLHAKSYVFDGCWSIVGSANLDFQSLRWNDEGNVGILDEGFGREMTEVFAEDAVHSFEIIEKVWRQRPFLERVKERFFVLFRRRL